MWWRNPGDLGRVAIKRTIGYPCALRLLTRCLQRGSIRALTAWSRRTEAAADDSERAWARHRCSTSLLYGWTAGDALTAMIMSWCCGMNVISPSIQVGAWLRTARRDHQSER
jgi:hypothetical protein